MDYDKRALAYHKKGPGKISIENKLHIRSLEDLSMAYTPGVAAPCREIHKDSSKVYDYTSKGNLVAVISDGSAVLGLGDIGAKASIPVMEGKAVLFKKFGGVDAVPICIDTKDTETFIESVKLLEPCFGGINLEDISSPRCFEIEKRLEEELDIPVFHDDQHGTAIVVTAALVNALKLVRKDIKDIRVVVNGPGAAGTAIIHMLRHVGIEHIIACDENGILHKGRTDQLPQHKRLLTELTNKEQLEGDLAIALQGADVFIGVSKGDILSDVMVGSMNPDAIIFALANPTPEISYEKALEAGARIVGTGRSDQPNQINNLLAFPGLFKGALMAKSRNITTEMKIAASFAIADLVSEEEMKVDYIIPSPFDERVAEHVAKQVVKAAESKT